MSFAAESGQITVLLGPNGAGKSTALRILTGLERADRGSALFGGVPYRELLDPLRRVGTSFGGSGAHPSRTGRGHLTWMAISNGIPRARIDEVLEMLDLGESARKQTGDYSLGIAQRLGLAAALLGSPDYLVLDEPANGLDAEGSEWIFSFVARFAQSGGTVLLSSHLMRETESLAQRIVIMAQGRVIQSGSVLEIKGGHSTLEAAYLSAIKSDRSRPGLG
nr:ATP-binding cassette domain-containing protein [Leucobacter sp. G161]